ncbi:MAG: hypothetical protein GX089_00960 [Fibrobacter sp.]|nr:hypothetical protein [Fibrobacter sp.]
MDLSKVIIKFTDDGIGEYGLHDGFFNAIAIVEGKEYNFQCCCTENDTINFSDCGYNDGICGDVNESLADLVGWDGVLAILKKAYEEYTK